MSEHVARRPGILPVLPLSEITRDNIKRECAGPSEFNTDDQGNEFERCPDNDNGHLYFHGWCVHCQMEAP